MGTLQLSTTIEARGPAGALVLSEADVAELAGGKRAAVRVQIGDRTAALRLAVMGGEYLIGMSKAARSELGVEIGQQVDATVTVDDGPREVVVPDELAAALAVDAAATATFDTLPYTARKEFTDWVAGAKRPETRQKRVAESVQLLREGKRRS